MSVEEVMISVIIPVYQVYPYLRKCVESVIGQTYKNLEIILIDDGATDGSDVLCDQFAERDNRIKVIHQKNAGLSAARNRGLDIRKGQYIAFVDSDDWIDENYIKFLYECCRDYCADIAQCSYFDVVDETETLDTKSNTLILYDVQKFCISEYSVLSWRCNLTWNKLYKTNLFDIIRFPEGRVHEDEYTTYQIIWKAKRIAVNSKKLYYYRHRSDSIMGKKTLNHVLDANEAYKRKIEFYQEKGLTEIEFLHRDQYLSWIKNQLKLFTDMGYKNDSVFEKFVQEKEKEEVLIQTHKWRIKNFGRHGFCFPFNLVNKGERIILYGAGDVGKQFYRQIYHLNYCTIVAWLDVNAEVRRSEGLDVCSPDEIDYQIFVYEKIVLAINDVKIVQSVIENMKNSHGVPREKIIYQIESF